MADRARPPGGKSSTALELATEQLHALSIRLLRRARLEDPKSGLSPARLSALSVVVYAGPLTLGELARIEQVRPPTVSRLVRGLVDEKLVFLRVNPQDGRSRMIEARARGRSVLEEARQRRLARLRSDLSRLSEREIEAVVDATAVLSSLFP